MFFLKFSLSFILVFASILSYSGDEEDKGKLGLLSKSQSNSQEDLSNKTNIKENNILEKDEVSSSESEDDTDEYDSLSQDIKTCIADLRNHSKSSKDQKPMIEVELEKIAQVKSSLRHLTESFRDLYKNGGRSIDDDMQLLLIAYNACEENYRHNEATYNAVCNKSKVCNSFRTTTSLGVLSAIAIGIIYNQGWHHGIFPPEFCWKKL